MKRLFKYILTVLAAVASTACSDELMNVEDELVRSNTVTLAANSSRLITKSGLQYTDFDVHTKYRLFAIETAQTYDWANAVMYNREGYESDEHLINYGKELFFNGRKMDFYGATLCSTKASPEFLETQGTPVIDFNLTDYGTEFPDLMYSRNLKSRTFSNGLLEMDFTHALSKVQIEISRQAETKEYKLKEIAIADTYGSGRFDIVEGTWSDVSAVGTAEGNGCRTFYTGETDIPVGDPKMIDNEMLIIPNETSKATVSLLITLEDADGVKKTYTSPLYMVQDKDDSSQSTTPFIFEQNHRYVLTVLLLAEGVRVIAVSPQRYEWIDVPLEPYMGQPVNFGGIMWMDRNLGAESADCENDWARTRGFYYQYGRNIPYIFDQEKFSGRHADKVVYRNEEQLNLGYEYFFTYNEKSEKVYGAVQGGTQKWHYKYHVSELTVDNKKVGWVNTGSGWEWQGATLVGYDNKIATPRFTSSNGKFTNGAFIHVTQKGYNDTDETDEWTESNGAPQWLHPDVTTSNIAINPGDNGIYHFIFDARYYHDWFQSGCWCVMDCKEEKNDAHWNHWRNLTMEEWTANYAGWETGTAYLTYGGWLLNHGCRDTRTEDTEKVNNFWVDRNGEPIPENHPCPKGWRIPTKEDFANIMADHNIENSWAMAENTMYVMPKTSGDVLPQYNEAAAYGVDALGRTVIYLIKRMGTDECYRLRLLWKDSNLSMKTYYNITDNTADWNMKYLEISRYPGNSEMSFDKYYNAEVGSVTTTNQGGDAGAPAQKSARIMTGDQLNGLGFLSDFNWENPTEVMQIPLCGFIYPGNGNDGMYSDGKMTILRCTDWDTNYDLVKRLQNGETFSEGAYPYNEAMNWCFYIRTNRATGLFSGSRKSLGDQIRCVRDVNAR